MSGDDPKDYKVGKGKPPKHTQFKPGQSGNPKGRPKGSKNVHHVLSKILGEKITITDSGKKMEVDKFEAALRVMVNKSYVGGPASLKLLFDTWQNFSHAEQSPDKNPFTDDDYASLMEELGWIEKVKAAQQVGESDGSE